MKLVERFLPYCIRKLLFENWIMLNRYYKPIGIKNTRRESNYNESNTIIKFKENPENILNEISVNIDKENDECIYYFLYNDGNRPYKDNESTKDYFSRLEKLMKLTE
jgi:hypothetical protein